MAVFGIGGVGSWAAEALARSGVGRLTIVDNDVSNNSLGGLNIDSVSAEVASLNIRRNAVLANLGTGVGPRVQDILIPYIFF